MPFTVAVADTLLGVLAHASAVRDKVFPDVVIVWGAADPLYNQPLLEEPKFHKYDTVAPGGI